MSWAEIKKAINDNLNVPLNKQRYIPRTITYMQSGIFKVPQSGFYMITCIGKGGEGGQGGYSGTGGTDSINYGGSGGSGAVIIEYLEEFFGGYSLKAFLRRLFCKGVSAC